MFLASVSYIYAQACSWAVLQWWSSFLHVRGREDELHRVSWGLAALQNTVWREMSRVMNDENLSQQWHPTHITTRETTERGELAVFRDERSTSEFKAIAVSHLACWGSSQCMMPGQACTQETRALHSDHARLLGCPAKHAGLRGRCVAHGIPVHCNEAWAAATKQQEQPLR